MARSAGSMANRSGRTQLLYDGVFESGKRDPTGTSSGYARKRAHDADQRAHDYRGQFCVGLCASDVLFIALSAIRMVVLRRALSRKLSSGADVSAIDHDRARVSRDFVGEFRNGLQARGSIRNISRDRLGPVFGSLLSHPTDQ